jgi:hypothetical protein
MATKRAEEIYEQYINVLPAAERLRLVQLIADGPAAPISRALLPSRSLLELEGLGVEIWPSIDARNAWMSFAVNGTSVHDRVRRGR